MGCFLLNNVQGRLEDKIETFIKKIPEFRGKIKKDITCKGYIFFAIVL